MVRAGRRRWLIGMMTLLILSGAAVVGYRLRRPAEEKADQSALPRKLEPRALTIVSGIHLLGGLAPSAAYVVETSEGLVLIDTGLDKDAVVLRSQMAELRLDWRSIRTIFLTHVHGDHTGGAQYLRSATGAKIHAGQGDAAVLRAGTSHDAFFSTYPMPASITPTPTTVDVELRDDEVITLGDVSFRALVTPGHTPGSVCYLMERGDQRILFSGDIIWALSVREDPKSIYSRSLGTYAAYLAPRYRGDARTFLDSLRRLRALPAPQLVLPGHPRNDPAPANPAMTQERWEALLDPGIREMQRLVERYNHDGANFLDGTPKRLLPELYYLGDRKNVAVYGFFVAGKFFLVNAPEEVGLDEFIEKRLHRLDHEPATPTAILLTSDDAEATTGLRALLTKHRCAVVAPPAAWETIKRTSPAGTDFIPAEELSGKGWFRVESIPLNGRGPTQAAYLLRFGDKTVLVSGRLPIKVSQATAQALVRDFVQGRANITQYRDSLTRLQNLAPDLWLPAVPIEGQNANLYTGDWVEVLTYNRALLR